MCCNLSHDKTSGRRGNCIADGTIETVLLNQKTIVLADVNNHLLHSDGDMSHYFIGKEHKSV
jgi:hypothetical protein